MFRFVLMFEVSTPFTSGRPMPPTDFATTGEKSAALAAMIRKYARKGRWGGNGAVDKDCCTDEENAEKYNTSSLRRRQI
jgi:hypothetical protein